VHDFVGRPLFCCRYSSSFHSYWPRSC
jgi:hypothetical protein